MTSVKNVPARLLLLQKATEKLSELCSHVEHETSAADRVPLHVWGDILGYISDGEDVFNLSCVCSRDGRGFSPLHSALDSDDEHLEVVELLLEAGAPVGMVDARGLSPLLMACSRGHVNIVPVLRAAAGAKAESDYSVSEWLPILLDASLMGRSAVIEAFMLSGIALDPVLKRETALLHAFMLSGIALDPVLKLAAGSWVPSHLM
eukprot:gene28332-31452_t